MMFRSRTNIIVLEDTFNHAFSSWLDAFGFVHIFDGQSQICPPDRYTLDVILAQRPFIVED